MSLPEGTDERILTAAKQLIEIGAVEITLLGDRKQLTDKMEKLDLALDLEKVQIINPVESPDFEDYATTLFELRKHKNVDLTMARDLMEDVSYFGTMMVYKGHADGMVSGAAHTTQHTILPALQFVKTKPEVSLVSSVFFMCLPDRVVVFGDCAINPNPTAEQLAEIAITSADTSAAFWYSTKNCHAIVFLGYFGYRGGCGPGTPGHGTRKAKTARSKSRGPHTIRCRCG